jgi:transposase
MGTWKMSHGDGSSGGSGRRRRWTSADKARIVAECGVPGSSVSIVARRHDLNANMLFTWRREFQRRHSGAAGDQVSFVPAVITPDEAVPKRLPPKEPQPAPEIGSTALPAGRIEIVLGNSRRIILDQDVSAAALARVIGVLERR